MCCGCPVDITRLMEDCYGLMGLEGKRGLTLTVCFLFVLFFWWGGGGGMGREGEGQTVSFYSAYWCLWHTMRLTSFRHYYFPQVLSMVT